MLSVEYSSQKGAGLHQCITSANRDASKVVNPRVSIAHTHQAANGPASVVNCARTRPATSSSCTAHSKMCHFILSQSQFTGPYIHLTSTTGKRQPYIRQHFQPFPNSHSILDWMSPSCIKNQKMISRSSKTSEKPMACK